MKSEFLKFLKSLTIITLIIGLISYLVQILLPVVSINPYWPGILVFMYAFTLYAFWELLKQFNNRIGRFTSTLMLVNFGKMFLYTIIIVIFAWFNRTQAFSFAITFFVYYLVITFFEIKALLKLK